MSLKKYNAKRNFKITTEPSGKKGKAKKGKQIFVIQLHAASHLHYDFRLEMDGVLKSWAVPKGPSLDPAIKRLAVHVEDHPMEYKSFEGIIPKGQYGAGTVIVWDKGTWEMVEEPKKSYKAGNFTFIMHGEKLKGLWKLVSIRKDPKNWLLIKVNDEAAKSNYDITKSKPKSVKSGKTLEAVKEEQATVWDHKSKSSKKVVKKKNLKSLQEKLKKIIQNLNVKKSKIPQTIHPQLATLVQKPPSTDNWIFELKYDGYRIISFLGSKLRLMTRGQQDWTHRFKDVANELKKVDLKDTVLDGEIVALDENNVPNFQKLQNTLQEGEDFKTVYYVFDLLYYDGYDLTELNILERKKILKEIIKSINSSLILYSDHIEGNGQQVFEQACQMDMEGIIAKETGCHYIQARTKNWLKIKCIRGQEFIICGYTKPRGTRAYFGSLVLGYYDKNKKLHYAGLVGTGFNAASLESINEQLKKYKTATCPFPEKPKIPNLASWVKPKLVAELEFREWTKDGVLRHPSFKGLREDKSSQNVRKEVTKPLKTIESKPDKKMNPKIHLTHPNKILYPEVDVTKADLANYYDTVSEWILPYVKNRPLSIVRCPQGASSQCFYQKHMDKNNANEKSIYKVEIKEKHGKGDYIYIKNKKGLLYLAQLSVLELHPWTCRIDNLEKPDMLIFDLDPAPNVDWEEVIDAAFILKKELEAFDLTVYVRTTGGKGLHVVFPIQRRYEWEDTILFAKVFVQYLVKKYPEKFVGTMSKSKRHGKIFVDYLRNTRGATAVASYSTRVRDNASIAVPLAWKELTVKTTSDHFTIMNINQRLSHIKDPWHDFFKIKQTLPRLK